MSVPDDRTPLTVERLVERPIPRRKFIKMAGAFGATAALSPAIAACGGDDDGGGGGGGGEEIKIGYVTPRTGPFSGFGEADSFVIGQVREALGKGVKIGNTTHPVEVIVKDTQSDPNRSAQVTSDLILNDGVHVVLSSGTPATVNPVSDQCEANGTPSITSVAPWQSWFIGRKGDPEKGFKWTYHFFWGVEDLFAVFLDMWDQVDTNKRVAALWPNDEDGNALADKKLGFPPALRKGGYTLIDPGRYPNGNDNFSSQISTFKGEDTELLTGVSVPPDFATFWSQAAQQGYRPKVATQARALLFPAAVEAIGEKAEGLTTEVWWTNQHPYKSSLTGQSAKQLADAYETSTRKQWTQPIGFAHANFEVAVDALKRAGKVGDRRALSNAIKETKLDTVLGNLDFSKGPVPNVAKTKLIGGQWRRGDKYPFELSIVSNQQLPEISKTRVRPIT